MVLKTRSWSLLTTPSKSSPSEAMMVVLIYVIVLGEVALRCEKACLCFQPSRVLDATLQRLVRRPKLECERENVRLKGVRMIEGCVFATLAPLFRSQTNFFASQSPPSLFLASLRTQAEPTPEGPRQPASLLFSLHVQSYVA
jgi:hypothetical protein